MTNDTIIIRNPNAVRPWQHVLEPITGYLSLGMHMAKEPVAYGQAYNFGPQSEDALSVEEMLNLALKFWGSGEYKAIKDVNQPHEAGLLKLDISKVGKELNWHPKMNANNTIDFTLQWYKEYQKKTNQINDFTENQIMSFLNE